MRYPYIDMHCDTLLRTYREEPERLYDGRDGMQGFRLMQEAGQMCQFFAVFFPPKERKQQPPLPPTDEEFFDRLCSTLKEQVSLHRDIIASATNAKEITENWKNGLASAFLTIEDGRMVNGKMENLQKLYDAGVRAIGLTWNYSNCFGFPNSTDPEIMKKGLTDFGISAIEEMNRLGIMVDVSHLSDGGFYDVAQLSKKPFIASHSNCRELTSHPRNLTDGMIRLLAAKGGIMGLNLYSEFVAPDGAKPESRIEYLVAHVLHMFHVGGEDSIGIGTDFDGIDGQLDIDKPIEMELLFDALHKKGLTERQMDKFAYGNALRVIKENMG